MEKEMRMNVKEQERPIEILLVEDNEDDIKIIQRVFEKIKFLNLFHIARSGEEALDFIHHRGKYAASSLSVPGLILLDIMMPGITGFDVLEKLKADPNYNQIPVIMLTTSGREEDIAKSFRSGACSFVTKPVDFLDFIKVVSQFELYWTMVSKIPSTQR